MQTLFDIINKNHQNAELWREKKSFSNTSSKHVYNSLFVENVLVHKMYENWLFSPPFLFPPKKRGKKKQRMK